jgi:rhodanese-related sulfurtransferase/DNA-binding transcriptional ArsR family regulator
MPTAREAKTQLYTIIAELAQAMANPHRLELLDLLVQAPRTVEQLAEASALTVANTSQHLQRLKRAGLVASTRYGVSIEYRLASPAVAQLWVELRRIAEQQRAELDRALDDYRPVRHHFPTISMAALREEQAAGRALLLDVRPSLEYTASHLAGAISLPLDDLRSHLGQLPTDQLLVTYCRGPLCVYADQALTLIAESGRRGARLEEGVAEWSLAGYPIETGAIARTN